MASVSSRRYAASSTATDAPVNCLLRLPLPTPVAASEGLGARPPFGAYGPLACGGADGSGKSAQNVEVVMVGCYKHDAATETYSGALRVATAPRVTSSSSAGSMTTLLDAPLPAYGVFDLTLVASIGGCDVCCSTTSLGSAAPDAASSRVFPPAFVKALVSSVNNQQKASSGTTCRFCDGSKTSDASSASSIIFLVAAPCTDGHLRLFAVSIGEEGGSNTPFHCSVLLVCDLLVAETMLTSVALFPQFGVATDDDEKKTLRAICASHGGSMHLITAVLEPQTNSDADKTDVGSGAALATAAPLFALSPITASDASSSISSPSFTHFTWEGHEYDSWCVSRDPIDPVGSFWSGGDDGKLKRWVMGAPQWAALDRYASGERPEGSGNGSDSDGDTIDNSVASSAKPSLCLTKEFDAGVVTISPLFVHSFASSSTAVAEAEGVVSRQTSAYLVVGSYDETLRVYHLANEKSEAVRVVGTTDGEREAPAVRAPLTAVWRRLMADPLLEAPCEGGAWRCRVPPPHAFLASQRGACKAGGEGEGDGEASWAAAMASAVDSEHTNTQESHVFVKHSAAAGSEEDAETLLPLSVAAMQRGGAVVLAPLPRYHALQARSLTAAADGSAVSSAVPLNTDLADEFTIDPSEHIIFLEKRQPEEEAAKEPLIYDVCPIGPTAIDSSSASSSSNPSVVRGLGRVLACSFYDKEILGFDL